MQYEPIKNLLGRFFSGPLYMRKALYMFLDLLLLRAWHVKKALKKISHELPPDANILDAGAGLGQYTWRMSRMNKDWKITAVDINEQQVKEGNDFFGKAGMAGKVKFASADLTTYNKPGSFNLILSVDVMEHIKEDEKVFSNFFNSLKENGIVLISTPSDKGGSDVHEDHDTSFIDEHVRDGYSAGEITEKLTRAGFRSAETKYTYGKAGSISWRLSMKYPVKMLNTSYLFFIILPFYYLIAFPVSVILNFFDLYIDHKSGTGLLVVARK
ncbi:MAG: class I SAM-dependent methyltransferase [Bacteroidales bacterium]